MKKISILVALIIFLEGCVYNGTLHQGFYNRPQENAKLPIKIDLVVAESLKTQKLTYAHMGGNPSTYNITFQPALTESLKNSFDSIFNKVEIIRMPIGTEDADFLIIPEYNVKLLHRNGWTGEVIFDTTFTINIKEPKTLKNISTHTNVQRVVRTPGGITYLMMIITGLSLYVLSPITFAIDAQAVGTKYVELFEEDIKNHLNILTDKIAGDPFLRKI